MLLITSLFALSWTLGSSAAHFQRAELVVLHMVSQLVLVVTILVLRCLLDAQVQLTEILAPVIGYQHDGLCDSGLKVRKNLRRFGKSNQELGETYQREHSARNGRDANGSAARHSRKSLVSAQSRLSFVSHNQVAPLTHANATAKTITPVEEDDQHRSDDGGLSGSKSRLP